MHKVKLKAHNKEYMMVVTCVCGKGDKRWGDLDIWGSVGWAHFIVYLSVLWDS